MKQSKALIKLKNLPDNTNEELNKKISLTDLEILANIFTYKEVLLDDIIGENGILVGDGITTSFDRYINLDISLYEAPSFMLLYFYLKDNNDNEIEYKSGSLTGYDDTLVTFNHKFEFKINNSEKEFLVYIDFWANRYYDENIGNLLVDNNKCCIKIKYRFNKDGFVEGIGITSEEISLIDTYKLYIFIPITNNITTNNVFPYDPEEDYNPSTKKYVDDSIANLPIKKIISTQENPIIISNLNDGIYDFGNTSYSKMFDSDTEILENILGICILYTVNENKKNLYVNFNKSVYDYKYELSTSNKNYILYKYNKIITIGGNSNQTLILLDDVPLNGIFGIYHTNCVSLKLTATSETVSLNSGPKILLISRMILNNICTYDINVFGAYISKKIVYEYDTSISEATLISDYNYALKDYVDDNIPKEETEEETLNKLLEYGLVSDALMLDDGTYLEDENGKLLQI